MELILIQFYAKGNKQMVVSQDYFAGKLK